MDNKINKIAELLGEKMAKTRKSQRDVAREMGISHSYVSDFLKKNTEKMSGTTIKKFAQYVGYKASDWQIIETSNYLTVKKLLTSVRSESVMKAISAYTGAGKTTPLKILANQTPNTFYVLGRSTNQKKNFLKEILRAMGVEASGTLDDLIMAICNRLKELDHPVLIIDDCGKLNDAVLLLIQIIFDETEGQAGILLSGTEYFYKYVQKMAEKDKRGFRELRRRIQYWQTLSRPSKNEITGICHLYEIKDLYAINYMLRNCQDFGTLQATITNALKAVDGDGDQVNIEILEALQIGTHEELRA